MDTVPQTVNCIDVLPRTSRHLHTMDEFGAGTLSLCHVSDGAAHEY